MKKNLPIVCFLLSISWLFFSASSALAAVPESSYQSLHQVPLMLQYNIQTSERRPYTGYRYQYNLDDPVVRCGQEGDTCAYREKYQQWHDVVQQLAYYKFYVAPGTVSLLNTIFTDNNARYVAIARLGQPPTGDYSYIRNLTDEELIKLNTLGFTEAQLRAGDCIAGEQEGILSLTVGEPISETKGDWLYVNLIQLSGNIRGIDIGNYVSVTPYMNWFHSATWDAKGDPTTPVPQPTPQPTPTPTPTPSDGVCGTANGQTFSTFPFGN